MATARVPLYTGVQSASDAATASTLVLRDTNGDFAGRRITMARSINTGADFRSSITKTTTYTATEDDNTILCDASGGAFTITLPAAAGVTGQRLTFVRTSSSGNVVIDGNGAETINGAATKTITTQYGAITIQCDGTGWYILHSIGTIT